MADATENFDTTAERQRESRRRYERRHVALRLRLKPAEKQALDIQARTLDTQPTTIALTAVRRACGLPSLLSPELKVVHESARQLGAVGRNLNQITRKINAGEFTPDFDSDLVSELADYVHAAAASVRELAEKSRMRWAPDSDE